MRRLPIACSFAALVLGACAPARQTRKPDPALSRPAVQQVTMEPLHLGLAPDPELGLVDFDATMLFREGLRFHEAGRHARALVFYDRLREEFPGSRLVSAAAYNAGRCLEELDRAEDALARYRLILDGMPRSKDWVDAVFRSGAVLSALGRHAEASGLYGRLLARAELSNPDRLDAWVLRGESFQAQQRSWDAEKAFRAVLRLFREREKDEYLDPAPAARAEFRLAELVAERFALAPLRLPEQRMQEDLEAKARLLLEAQSGYLRSMRYGDPDWAIAAGYRIGKLYVDLHAALEAADLPPDLDEREAQVYRELLRERLAVLLRKALRVFEATIQLAERTRSENRWTRAAREEMTRVEKQVLSQLGHAPPQEPTKPEGPPAPDEEPDRS
ncbi:MAG: tetratricopeptide repeat protein [Deltaproteobacteria bacterium]|nr:tetratricopeptide repeat protein [Deltaproteobacteria bacterium]